jgi:hypothetical protein
MGMGPSISQNLLGALLRAIPRANFWPPTFGDSRHSFGHKLTGVCLHCDSLGGLQMRWVHLIALVIGIMAIVGVFIEIPFVSQYAFWVMTVAFLMLASLRW